MSYQVLARKYRPKTFEEVVGQEPVVKALTHALRENRLHHAYLFTGTRGVGKTTLARILAKSLNCVGPDGNGPVTDHPCGVCPVCRAIDEGRFVDYIEMDAASNRSVEEMTALLEQAMYAPTNARYKVYMIDEVHQLTTHAFNAMLKTLEEPPEYVKFILATTDPQKVPVTVLSRCLQFNLRNVAPQVVANHLGRVMQNEGLQAEPQALRLIGEAARGSLRDGLSLLDQAVAYVGSDPVTLKSVREMLGIMDGDVLTELLKKIAAEDAAGVMRTADDMAASGVSFGEALKDLASLLHRIAIAQKVPEALSREDLDYADIRTLASAFTPEEIQLFYQIALHGKADLHLAPDEYAGFTMTLLRMLAFKPQGSALSAKARVAASEKQPPFDDAAQGQKPSGGDIQPAPKAPAEPRPVKKVESSPEFKTPPRAREVKKEVPPKAAEVEAPEVDIPEDEFLQDTVPEDFEYGFSDMAPAQSDFEPAVSAPVETVEEKLPDAFDDENRVFSELGKIWFEKMGRTFPASFTRDIIENAELLQLDATTLTLRLEPFYESRTKNPATMRLLHKIVDSAFGQQMTIRFEWSAPMSRTIAQEKRAARKAATKETELSNEERTRAQAILKGSAQAKILARRFNAKIAPETIRKQ